MYKVMYVVEIQSKSSSSSMIWGICFGETLYFSAERARVVRDLFYMKFVKLTKSSKEDSEESDGASETL